MGVAKTHPRHPLVDRDVGIVVKRDVEMAGVLRRGVRVGPVADEISLQLENFAAIDVSDTPKAAQKPALRKLRAIRLEMLELTLHPPRRVAAHDPADPGPRHGDEIGARTKSKLPLP